MARCIGVSEDVATGGGAASRIPPIVSPSGPSGPTASLLASPVGLGASWSAQICSGRIWGYGTLEGVISTVSPTRTLMLPALPRASPSVRSRLL
jgi:hypothetical protein